MDLTFGEMYLIDKIYESASDPLYESHVVKLDVEQGVFTQTMIDEMVNHMTPLAGEYPRFATNVFSLVGELETNGQIIGQPLPFTADELTQMQFLMDHNPTDPVIHSTIHAAEHVGFWTDGQLARLYAAADYYTKGVHTQDAVSLLVSDLTIGNQIAHGIVGIHLDAHY